MSGAERIRDRPLLQDLRAAVILPRLRIQALQNHVAVHPRALADVPGSLCAPFERERWRAAAAAALAQEDPRVPGRRSAERWSSARMAERVIAAWEHVLAAVGGPRGA